MNQYHIFQEIGRGKHTTVYKGRKKKTVEYVAIKSVDKVQRAKVTNEVRILQTLDQPNVLKFHQWYETTNHIWVIVEFCTGGDLLTMIAQDAHLPESSIRETAEGILVGLQFLHSKSIIYGDLKPSNLLLDNNGQIKFSDFGLSQRLSDIKYEYNEQMLSAKRGTLCYMAPELLTQGGVYSFASDFWSLGCVLYEMYTGKPPFVSTSLHELMDLILTSPYPPLQNASPEFASLVDSLLQKDPLRRATWTELLDHPFWSIRIPKVPLPPQPQFDAYAAAVKSRFPASLSTSIKEKSIRASASGVDLLRLSRIVKANMKDSESVSQDYRGENRGMTEGGDVYLKNYDDELVFREGVLEEEGDEDGDDPATESHEAEYTKDQKNPGESESEPDDVNSIYQDKSDPSRQVTPLTMENQGPAKRAFTTTPNTAVNQLMQEGPKITYSDTRAPPTDPRPYDAQSDVGTPSSARPTSSTVDRFVFHKTDFMVKPIIMNQKIEKISETKYETKSFTFPHLGHQEVLALETSELEKFLTAIYKSLSNAQTPVPEKLHVLRYVTVLCKEPTVANIFVRSTMMSNLIKVAKQFKVSTLRSETITVVAILIRFAKYIPVENAVLVPILTDMLRENSDRKVKRKVMAATGEILFYLASQPQSEQSLWQLPSSIFNLVSRCLRGDEDDIVQQYAAQTIENIAAYSQDYSRKFAGQETIFALLHLFNTSRIDNMRATCASALARLSKQTHDMQSSSFIQQLIEKAGLRSVVLGLSESNNPKTQQSFINLLNMAMLDPTTRLQTALLEDKRLIPSLFKLFEHSSLILRAKALVTVRLLCRMNIRWIWTLTCQSKIIPSIERLSREKDQYVLDCLEALLDELGRLTPDMSNLITGELNKIIARKTTATPSQNKGHLTLMSALVNLMGNTITRSRIVSKTLLIEISSYLRHLDNPAVPADFKKSILAAAEVVSQYQPTILEHFDVMTQNLLPSLAAHFNCEVGDTRFFCIKTFSDILLFCLEKTGFYANQVNADEGKSKRIDDLVTKYFFPSCKEILLDNDPIPIFGLKVLNSLANCNPSYVSLIHKLHLSSYFFIFLQLDHANNNVHNLLLIKHLIECPDVERSFIYEQGIVEKLAEAIRYSFDNRATPYFEPCFDTLYQLLYRAAEYLHVNSSSQDSQIQTTQDMTYFQSADHCIIIHRVFLRMMHVYTILACGGDPWSERCSQVLSVLSKMYTVEFLEQFLVSQNISNIGALIRGASATIVKRILKVIKPALNHPRCASLYRQALREPGFIGPLQELRSHPDAGLASLATALLVQPPW